MRNEKQSLHLTEKYWSESRLGFGDNLASEPLFYDPGYLAKATTLPSTVPPLSQILAPNSTWGEVMVVDLSRDVALCEFIAELKSAVNRLTDKAEQYSEVSKAVARRHGGQGSDIEQQTDAELKRLRKKAGASEMQGFEILIGSLRFGVCRHRALLFKVCCDALGLECSLLRGEFKRYGKGGAHAWNVVRIYNEAKVADVMNRPGTFLEDTADEVRGYKRVVEQGNWGSKGGAGLSAGMQEAQRPQWYIPAGDIDILKQDGRDWKIGSGPYGSVFKARLRGTEVVAVKRLKASQRGMELFSHELEMLQRLRHEHIVTFRGACHDSGDRLLVTEYAAGGDLGHARLEYPETFTWSVHGLRVCLHVARALYFMHSCVPPVVHNDLNPHNILLSEGFAVAKVADVGLANLVHADSSTTKPSPARNADAAYTAPELAKGNTLSEKADIYSFGVLLHQIVHECLPAGPKSVAKNLPPGCPVTLAQLCEHCLAVDARSRPSAADLVRKLEDLVERHCKPWQGVLPKRQPAKTGTKKAVEPLKAGSASEKQAILAEARSMQDAAKQRQASSGESFQSQMAAAVPARPAIVVQRSGADPPIKVLGDADLEKLKSELRACLHSQTKGASSKASLREPQPATDLHKLLHEKRREALKELDAVEQQELGQLWNEVEKQLGKVKGQALPLSTVPQVKDKFLQAVRDLKASQAERRRSAESDMERQIAKHVQEQKQAQAQLNRQLEGMSKQGNTSAAASAGLARPAGLKQAAGRANPAAAGTKPGAINTTAAAASGAAGAAQNKQIRCASKAEAQAELQRLRKENEVKLAEMEAKELKALAEQAKAQVSRVSGTLSAVQLQQVKKQCAEAEQQLRKKQQERRRDLERQIADAAQKIKAAVPT